MDSSLAIEKPVIKLEEKMKKLLLTLFAFASLLPSAQAQIAFAPADFIQKIGAKKVGMDWKVGKTIFRFETLAGSAYKIEYIGSPTDTRFAAKALQLIINSKMDMALLEKEIRSDWVKYKDLGSFISPGNYFDVEVDWTSERLRFKVMTRELFNLGQDRIVFGQSGVLMRVFSDFECPACQSFLTKILPYMTERWINTGQLRYSYRHNPLDFHPKAIPAAIAAECSARQNKFWEYHLLLAKSLKFMIHAKALKFNQSFQACLSDPTARAAVIYDLKIAKTNRISSTPTILIGRFLIRDYHRIENYILMAQALGK